MFYGQKDFIFNPRLFFPKEDQCQDLKQKIHINNISPKKILQNKQKTQNIKQLSQNLDKVQLIQELIKSIDSEERQQKQKIITHNKQKNIRIKSNNKDMKFQMQESRPTPQLRSLTSRTRDLKQQYQNQSSKEFKPLTLHQFQKPKRIQTSHSQLFLKQLQKKIIQNRQSQRTIENKDKKNIQIQAQAIDLIDLSDYKYDNSKNKRYENQENFQQKEISLKRSIEFFQQIQNSNPENKLIKKPTKKQEFVKQPCRKESQGTCFNIGFQIDDISQDGSFNLGNYVKNNLDIANKDFEFDVYNEISNYFNFRSQQSIKKLKLQIYSI